LFAAGLCAWCAEAGLRPEWAGSRKAQKPDACGCLSDVHDFSPPRPLFLLIFLFYHPLVSVSSRRNKDYSKIKIIRKNTEGNKKKEAYRQIRRIMSE